MTPTPQEDRPADLLPCPFCGSTPAKYFEETEESRKKIWQAHCPKIGCLEALVPIEIWQCRAPQSVPGAPAADLDPAVEASRTVWRWRNVVERALDAVECRCYAAAINLMREALALPAPRSEP